MRPLHASDTSGLTIPSKRSESKWRVRHVLHEMRREASPRCEVLHELRKSEATGIGELDLQLWSRKSREILYKLRQTICLRITIG